MERTLPLDWRKLGLVALWTVNLILLLVTLAAFLYADVAVDWTAVYSQLGPRLSDGTLYDWPDTIYAYRYSPVLAYAFAAIAPIGTVAWLVLHFAPLPLLGWKLGLITLASFPFWSDVYNGNVMVFVFVCAVLALKGSRWAQYAFLALTLLIPRPLMLPVAAWLLWRHRALWIPFAGIFLAHALLVLWTGYGPEWIGSLLSRGGDDIGGHMDFGPSVLIGAWWAPIGLVVAAWLTWKGRLGLASIAASPYWLPPYLLMGLLPVTGQLDVDGGPLALGRAGPRDPDGRERGTAERHQRRLGPAESIGVVEFVVGVHPAIRPIADTEQHPR